MARQIQQDRDIRGGLRGVGRAALVVSLSLGIAALPVAPGRGVSTAEARGGGGGGGGQGGGPGEPGGRGGGNEFGQGVAAGARGDNQGRGGGEGGGRGGDRGALAWQFGALNAARASPTARANAAADSRVGMIAA